MSLARTLSFILDHPLNRPARLKALGRYVRWQIGSRVLGAPAMVPFGQRSVLVATPGMTGATQNFYCGLHEFADMAFLLHLLRPGDLFVDVGANIGSYSVLASEAGAKCFAFEPVPSTFAILKRNIIANERTELVSLWNAGVADRAGTMTFTASLDTTNHVVSGEDHGATVEVPVVSLDEVVQQPVTAIKVDVEGYETPVIDGASRLISGSGALALIIELNGSGRRYGFSDEELTSRLRALGYAPFTYSPFARALVPQATSSGEGNTIFVRDEAEVSRRLSSGPKVTINQVTF